MNILHSFAAGATSLANNIPHVDLSMAKVNSILGYVYMLAGAIAVVFIIIGGIRYILSAGDSSKVTQAKSTIQYAIVGLIIVLLAFAITNFILGSFSVSSFSQLRDSVINTLIYVAGTIAVIMVIYGAFRYATSGGNSSSVTAAKNTIMYAVIGLVVSILAFAIVNFVIGSF